MPPATAYLSLGSNLGERESHLACGLALLGERAGALTRVSSLYCTAPVGGPPQGDFLNLAARIETALTPEALLAVCLAIETERGRVRAARCGPRTLDIDLLLYGHEVRDSPQLRLPHPRLHERLFVLAPLCEIAPEVRHPLCDLTISTLCALCTDTSRVARRSAALPQPKASCREDSREL